jgi:hypothetical protein
MIESTKPAIGQLCTIRGLQCRIIAIENFGTIVVESLDGLYYFRVSGLSY